MKVDLSREERLSAFMDGDSIEALPERAQASFVDRLLGDEDMRSTWTRYHLIGDCIRSGTPAYSADLSAAISLRLQNEPTVLAPRSAPKNSKKPHRQHSWVTGAAIAAGMAALVVVGVNQFDRTTIPGSEPIAEVTPAPAIQAEQSGFALVGDRDRSTPRHEPAISSKLDRYLANHSDFAADGSLNGMVPLATFINYYE